MKYIAPKAGEKSFTCPHCGVLSKQEWISENMNLYNESFQANIVKSGLCQHCGEHTLWIREKMFYPETGISPFPNPEMPESVKKLYLEAASISTKSPRGASALLRLAIQVLCKELGESGKNINNDIKNLVSKGLPTIVQQSLDIVRVTGNNAVHPGQIDTDDINVVNKLFELINIIIEYMIALPKQVSGLYSSLPKDKLDGIEKRDK
ncbi:hypothetical protein ES705_35203 [subsurface metagenome]